MNETQYSKGLEGVIATESKICKIDGLQGLLSYRGYRIEELVEGYDFEQVVYLLLEGELPDGERARRFCQMLRNNREVSPKVIDVIRAFPVSAHPMEILQSVILFLATERKERGEATGPNCEGAERLIAQFTTLVAAIHHTQAGSEIIPPRADLNHGANFLYMLHGAVPSETAAAVMDACFTLHAEHSLNASTFTARVVSSTMANCYASISGAVGSLSGPLHGGANERVLRMVREIESVERAEAWVDAALERKQKIMGMGHRVYKAKDPRAIVIEKLLAKLNQELPHSRGYDILKKVENRVGWHMEAKGKPIYPNVDFFSGVTYEMLEIPTNLFTALFAAARVAGWMAHIREQMEDNRIYRPKALYNGSPIRAL